jgi:hypothetical protein
MIMKLFKDNDFEYSWDSIKIGWDLGCVGFDEVKKFILIFLESNPALINVYIAAENKKDVDELLRDAFIVLNLDLPKRCSSRWNKEWRKWRFCFLSDFVKRILNQEELLIKVEGVYADFGYPEDMKSFIYYMPADDTIEEEDPEDARGRLVKKLKCFLEEESIRIKNGCDFLPRTMYGC